MIENIDFFYKNAGQHKEVFCLTCGSSCSVERNRSGPSWDVYIYKMGKGQKSTNEDKHDRFIYGILKRPCYEKKLQLLIVYH